jgi:hypothetical protein
VEICEERKNGRTEWMDWKIKEVNEMAQNGTRQAFSNEVFPQITQIFAEKEINCLDKSDRSAGNFIWRGLSREPGTKSWVSGEGACYRK